MICPKCGCKIKGNANQCPLCDTILVDTSSFSTMQSKKGVAFYKNHFTLIYIVAFLAVFAVLFIISKTLELQKTYWLTAIYALFPIYYVIRHTVLGIRNPLSKISLLDLVMLIFMIATNETTGFVQGYYFICTSFDLLFFLLSLTLVITKFNQSKPYICGFWTQTLVAWVPFVCCIAKGYAIVFPLITAIIITLFTVIITCIYPKEMVNQIKRFFAS